MQLPAPRARAGRLLAAPLLLALGAAPASAPAPARAATPAAEATQQLFAAQTAARTNLRSALALASQGATISIAAVEAGLAVAGNGTAAGNSLFAALQAFQVAVDGAMVAAADAQANGARDALATLGTPLSGIYPPAFYPGERSPTAGFEKAFAKELSKTYTKLHKRLGKTAAKFEAAGFGLTFRLAPPRLLPFRLWSEDIVDFQVTIPAQIDVVLAWSDLAATGDGQIRLGGGASINLVAGLGDVTLFATTDGANAQVDATPAGGRYGTDFGQAFPEGVWLLIVSQASLTGTETTIGVR